MKVLVVLGVALLCLCQVYGEGDILKSLFEEKVQNLSREKREAVDPPKYPCNANELIANGTQIIQNTLNIVQKTFAVVYNFVYPNSQKCDLAPWRCYINEFVHTKDNINLVIVILRQYRDKSSDLVNIIKDYFSNCVRKNINRDSDPQKIYFY